MNAVVTPITQAIKSGPKVLLQGDIGSGKTTALRSLVELGKTVFVLSTEPGIADILGDIPPDKCHWHYVPPFTPNFSVLLEGAKMLNNTNLDVLQKASGYNKQNHQEYYRLMHAANNFKCDRTGEEFGDIQGWGPERVFALDSLSGLTRIAVGLITGDKPFMNFNEYTAVQYLISNFINTIASSTKAWFVVTAHVERETDPQTGKSELMVSTTGKALAPVIPRYFSDVIHTRMIIREGKPAWVWDTISDIAKVKSRNLPLQANLEANFKLLDANWKSKSTA